jgi:GDPmannose 4,6-dehydratase
LKNLIADAGRAREKLDWKPSVTFSDLTRIMVDADLREAGLEPPGEGDEFLARKYPDRWWTRD